MILNNGLLTFALAAIALTGACKTTAVKSPGSDVKFGHLQGWSNTTILTVSPGETVFICDKGVGSETTQLIRRALDEWIAHSSLEGSISSEFGCDVDPLIPTINVQMNECSNEVNWAETKSTGSRRWVIRFCRPDALSYDMALHEMGHIFGQCDRYSHDASLFHPTKGLNCTDIPNATDGKFEIKSAMQAGGPGHPQKVTLDDANGVFALLQRDDVKGAENWRNYMKQSAKDHELKSQLVTTATADKVTLFIYFSRRVQKVEVVGDNTIAFSERRQPQKTWPDIRAAYVNSNWRNAGNVKLKVTRIDGEIVEMTVKASHR